MRKPLVRQVIWVLAVTLVSIVAWRFTIPNLTSFEAPGWDESDRAKDALLAFRGLTHFNPFPLLSQLLFFQTWGPLFTTLSQIPLTLFGASAQSLTLVSFSGLVFATLGPFWVVKEKLGWFSAIATVAFSFFWLVGAPSFGPYFVTFMLEAWVIVGFTAIALSGAVASPGLLIVGSWIVFAAKYQYYPVFFVSFAVALIFRSRRHIHAFVKEFFATKSAKILFAVALIIVAHIIIMKTAGPIYGKDSWNQPRALRNPVLIVFIIGTLLLYLRRQSVFTHLVHEAWESKFIKAFFWPATVLLAFPWPNRWAGVMVTQSYQAESKTLSEIVHLYAAEISNSLTAPFAASVLLVVLFAALIVGFARKCFARTKATQSGFVFLLFLVLTLTMLLAVKNVQPRFAFVIFLSVPIGLFAYTLSLLHKKLRIFGAVAMTLSMLAILILTPYFRAQSFFLGHLHEHTNSTYFDHTELYPLDRSLGELVKPLYTGRLVRLAIVQSQAEWLWDRPMQIWPLTFEIKTGVEMEAPRFYVDRVCEQAAVDKPDLIVKAVDNKWEKVECALSP